MELLINKESSALGNKDQRYGAKIKDIQNQLNRNRLWSIGGFAAAIICILLIIGIMLFADFPRHPHTIAWNQSLASYGFLWQNCAHLLFMGLVLYMLGQVGLTYYSMIKIQVNFLYILFGLQCLAGAWQLGIFIWDCWDIRFFTDCASIPQCAVYPAFFDLILIGMFVIFLCVGFTAIALIVIALDISALRGVKKYFKEQLGMEFEWKPEFDFVETGITKYLYTSKKAMIATAKIFDHDDMPDDEEEDYEKEDDED
jgi:hypothetical protein